MSSASNVFKERMREDASREGSAFKHSGPWFIAAIAALALGIVLWKLGVGVPAAILTVASLFLLPFAVHKHGKAGGDTSGFNAGMSSD